MIFFKKDPAKTVGFHTDKVNAIIDERFKIFEASILKCISAHYKKIKSRIDAFDERRGELSKRISHIEKENDSFWKSVSDNLDIDINRLRHPKITINPLWNEADKVDRRLPKEINKSMKPKRKYTEKAK